MYRKQPFNKETIIKIVGYGTAASVIGPMEDELKIVVHEWFSMYDGTIETGTEEAISTSFNDDGIKRVDSMDTTEVITAKWMQSGSNRMTAPNIKVGERVEILQEVDRDIYYWRPVGLDEFRRKLETIIWGISGTPHIPEDSLDPDHRYWIEFSSHSKLITLTTSDRNGEKTRYNLTIDPGNGKFHIMDARGNSLSLDTMADLWEIETTQGAKVTLDKQDISLEGNNVSIKGSTKTTIDGGGSTMVFDSRGIKWSAPTFTGN